MGPGIFIKDEWESASQARSFPGGLHSFGVFCKFSRRGRAWIRFYMPPTITPLFVYLGRQRTWNCIWADYNPQKYYLLDR